MEWISVKDRLPSDSMPCFLSGVDRIFDDGQIGYFRTIGSLTEGTDSANNKISYWIDWGHESMIENVTHWMPLPEPPQP